MGMNFSVHCDGFIVVESVMINGAAYRAAYENGIRCPVRQNDEIIEINHVPLMVNISGIFDFFICIIKMHLHFCRA